MGGFQAVAAGLGGAAEDVGHGYNDAITQALKVRAQAHIEDYDTQRLGIERAAQAQQYQLAQQSHELMREQLIQSGWNHVGLTIDPSTGQYYQIYDNPRMPAGQQTRKIPYQGVPPDSPQAVLSYYNSLKNMEGATGHPVFTDLQAKQIAFKMPQLYREGPSGMMQGFNEYAQELNDQGIGKVKSSTGKLVDLSTPEGRQAFAQDQLDLIYGKGGFFRYNLGANAAKDQTGWSANEKREYDVVNSRVKMMEELMLKSAGIQMQNTLDPTAQAQISQGLINAMEPHYKELEDKATEIANRHKTSGANVEVISPQGVQGTIPRANLQKALSQGYKLANPNQQVQ